MIDILWLFNTLIELYLYVIIANAVLSWLVAFNVINTSNRLVYSIMDATYRLTEPALRPIRQVIPNLGGLDISPLILWVGITFIQRIVNRALIGMMY
jgi:YggT family protein